MKFAVAVAALALVFAQDYEAMINELEKRFQEKFDSQ